MFKPLTVIIFLFTLWESVEKVLAGFSSQQFVNFRALEVTIKEDNLTPIRVKLFSLCAFLLSPECFKKPSVSLGYDDKAVRRFQMSMACAESLCGSV